MAILGDILQNNWPEPFQSVRVVKAQEKTGPVVG